jgi:hypothetical protein
MFMSFGRMVPAIAAECMRRGRAQCVELWCGRASISLAGRCAWLAVGSVRSAEEQHATGDGLCALAEDSQVDRRCRR